LAKAHKDYSGTPLYRKLGIKEESLVHTVSPPEGFFELLGPLPPGAAHVEEPLDGIDVALLFVTAEQDLRAGFEKLSRRLARSGGLWVAWPKKASKIPSALTFEAVQRVGLDAGLVDNKSCAIDEDWQAMRFVYRLKDRPTRVR
jgi:hypothetical protein